MAAPLPQGRNNMNEEELSGYPVYKSLIHKPTLFGIGQLPFYSILILTVILVGMVSFYCIAIGIILLLSARMICKKDKHQIDFLFEDMMEADHYEG